MSRIPSTLAPHPAPEIRGRIAEMHEIPKNAIALAILAYKHGWSVGTTYARGTSMSNKGAPGPVVDSIVVRIHRTGMRLAACWIDGHYSTTAQVTATGLWSGAMTLAVVRRIVSSGPLR